MNDPRTFHGFRQHVSEQRFEVFKQPIVNLPYLEVSHHEWLVRFDHDARLEQLLRPAEISGAIKDLDLSMLARAVLTLNSNPQRTGIAINISGASIDKDGFEHSLMACLSAYTAPPSKLTIELTETWNMDNLAKASKILETLRSRGHKVCLDDVGAGAASIHYLRALPADWLKIDGEFVVAAMNSPREEAILNAVMSLRGPLGVKFIAEGVENQAILEFVRTCGFDAAQGYALGKPCIEELIA